jgi:hypothetical protein
VKSQPAPAVLTRYELNDRVLHFSVERLSIRDGFSHGYQRNIDYGRRIQAAVGTMRGPARLLIGARLDENAGPSHRHGVSAELGID